MSRFCSTSAAKRLAALSQTTSSLSRAQIFRVPRFRHSFDATSRYSTATQVLRNAASFGLTEQPTHEPTLDAQDEAELEGSDSWVTWGKRQERRTIIVRGFDPDTTTVADIKQMLDSYGEIVQLSESRSPLVSDHVELTIPTDLHGRAVCYVEFTKLSAARSVIYTHKSHPFSVNDMPLKIQYAVDIVEVGEPSRLLWVSGLDMSIRPDLEELKKMFEQYGEVENIILSASTTYFFSILIELAVDRKDAPTCIIRYTSPEEATEALKAHREERFRYRGLALQLRYSHTKPLAARTPNPQLHIMGYAGNQSKLLAYIPEHAAQVRDIYMSA